MVIDDERSILYFLKNKNKKKEKMKKKERKGKKGDIADTSNSFNITRTIDL